MSTISNQIQDAKTLRASIVALDNILYRLAYASGFTLNTHLTEALKEASMALVVLTDELLDVPNFSLATGQTIQKVKA